MYQTKHIRKEGYLDMERCSRGLQRDSQPHGKPIHTDDDIGLQGLGRANHKLDIYSKGPSGVFSGQKSCLEGLVQ
jgi:hypothetical protein